MGRGTSSRFQKKNFLNTNRFVCVLFFSIDFSSFSSWAVMRREHESSEAHPANNTLIRLVNSINFTFIYVSLSSADQAEQQVTRKSILHQFRATLSSRLFVVLVLTFID